MDIYEFDDLNIYHDILKVHNPALYQKMWDWVIENYGKPGKKDSEVFGKRSKYALREFFDEIYSMDKEMEKNIEAMVYAHALLFFKAFKSEGYASKVRELL